MRPVGFLGITAAGMLLAAGAVAQELRPGNGEKLHVVLIGGFDSDPTPDQLAGKARRGEGNSGMYQLRGDLRARNVSAEYFNWNGTAAGDITAENAPGPAAIVDHVAKSPCDRLAIVGNSWGGHTAWEVCETLCKTAPTIRVDLVVFLDPSSAGRPMSTRPLTLPDNVAKAVQYASRSAIVWRPWPADPRIEDIDLANPQTGFLRPGGPPYAAMFSPNAHIGAEWDDKIHADIVRRLLNTPITRP